MGGIVGRKWGTATHAHRMDTGAEFLSEVFMEEIETYKFKHKFSLYNWKDLDNGYVLY